MCVCYSSMFLLFMVRQPPRTTVTNTLVPSTTLFGYLLLAHGVGGGLLGVLLVLGPVLGVGVLGLLVVVLLDAHLGGVLGVVDVAVPLDVGADGEQEAEADRDDADPRRVLAQALADGERDREGRGQIGRESCRERVSQYV